jgi:hypothetical protein
MYNQKVCSKQSLLTDRSKLTHGNHQQKHESDTYWTLTNNTTWMLSNGGESIQIITTRPTAGKGVRTRPRQRPGAAAGHVGIVVE